MAATFVVQQVLLSQVELAPEQVGLVRCWPLGQVCPEHQALAVQQAASLAAVVVPAVAPFLAESLKYPEGQLTLAALQLVETSKGY